MLSQNTSCIPWYYFSPLGFSIKLPRYLPKGYYDALLLSIEHVLFPSKAVVEQWMCCIVNV